MVVRLGLGVGYDHGLASVHVDTTQQHERQTVCSDKRLTSSLLLCFLLVSLLIGLLVLMISPLMVR